MSMRMSFFDGSLDKNKAHQIIANTKKNIRYTYGFTYRNPTTKRKLISKEVAHTIIDTQPLLDIDFEKDYIHLNAYSDNDMW